MGRGFRSSYKASSPRTPSFHARFGPRSLHHTPFSIRPATPEVVRKWHGKSIADRWFKKTLKGMATVALSVALVPWKFGMVVGEAIKSISDKRNVKNPRKKNESSSVQKPNPIQAPSTPVPTAPKEQDSNPLDPRIAVKLERLEENQRQQEFYHRELMTQLNHQMNRQRDQFAEVVKISSSLLKEIKSKPVALQRQLALTHRASPYPPPHYESQPPQQLMTPVVSQHHQGTYPRSTVRSRNTRRARRMPPPPPTAMRSCVVSRKRPKTREGRSPAAMSVTFYRSPLVDTPRPTTSASAASAATKTTIGWKRGRMMKEPSPIRSPSDMSVTNHVFVTPRVRQPSTSQRPRTALMTARSAAAATAFIEDDRGAAGAMRAPSPSSPPSALSANARTTFQKPLPPSASRAAAATQMSRGCRQRAAPSTPTPTTPFVGIISTPLGEAPKPPPHSNTIKRARMGSSCLKSKAMGSTMKAHHSSNSSVPPPPVGIPPPPVFCNARPGSAPGDVPPPPPSNLCKPPKAPHHTPRPARPTRPQGGGDRAALLSQIRAGPSRKLRKVSSKRSCDNTSSLHPRGPPAASRVKKQQRSSRPTASAIKRVRLKPLSCNTPLQNRRSRQSQRPAAGLHEKVLMAIKDKFHSIHQGSPNTTVGSSASSFED